MGEKHVGIGTIWRDNDPRMAGRCVVVIREVPPSESHPKPRVEVRAIDPLTLKTSGSNTKILARAFGRTGQRGFTFVFYRGLG